MEIEKIILILKYWLFVFKEEQCASEALLGINCIVSCDILSSFGYIPLSLWGLVYVMASTSTVPSLRSSVSTHNFVLTFLWLHWGSWTCLLDQIRSDHTTTWIWPRSFAVLLVVSSCSGRNTIWQETGLVPKFQNEGLFLLLGPIVGSYCCCSSNQWRWDINAFLLQAQVNFKLYL